MTNSIITFTTFRNSATTIEDISTLPEHAGGDKASGLLYADGRLFIKSLTHNIYSVDLWGFEFQGSLQDCEAALWHAALNENVLEASQFEVTT